MVCGMRLQCKVWDSGFWGWKCLEVRSKGATSDAPRSLVLSILTGPSSPKVIKELGGKQKVIRLVGLQRISAKGAFNPRSEKNVSR